MSLLTVLKINDGDEGWYRRTSQDGLAEINPIYYEPDDGVPFYFLPIEILSWPAMPESVRQIYLDLDTVDIEVGG